MIGFIKFTNSPLFGVNWNTFFNGQSLTAAGIGLRTNPIAGIGLERHVGLDINQSNAGPGATAGSTVSSVASGKIIEIRRVRPEDINKKEGYGNTIVIEHKEPGSDVTYRTRYAHLQQDSIPTSLQQGNAIQGGVVLGKVGSTGKSSGPHLHFELRVQYRTGFVPMDPAQYLKNIGSRIEITEEQIARQSNALDVLTSQITQNNAIPPVPLSPAAISPFINSLESFHPKIQYELSRRRVASETANTYMPFVRLTSLMVIDNENLVNGGEAWCPSLGLHGENAVSFDDIYSSQQNRSVIGYATQTDGNGGFNRVKVVVKDASSDPQNIPMPGITEITTEKGTAGPMGVRGGLMRANIKITAYSVGQVDALLRYFLRPATRVVLELGRVSSNTKEKPIIFYDWAQPKDAIRNEYTTLITDKEKQKEFIQKYVYGSYGNYEILLAYIVKFNLKYNKNNTYEIELVAHSVQQFELPVKHTGVKSLCPDTTEKCRAMDIEEYFNSTYSWKENSFAKLMSVYSSDSSIWKGHVIPIRNQSSNSTGAASTEAGTRENEYFVSWRFFIEKILNDRQLGVMSVLGNQNELEDIIRLGVPRPTKKPTADEMKNGLVANEVGYHPSLRSTNPEIMIIYNPSAQQSYNSSNDKNRYESIIRIAEVSGSQNTTTRLNILNNSSILSRFSGSVEPGPFAPYSGSGDSTQAGVSHLFNGVWINTKSIKQAFSTTDTVTSAITNLLAMMNSATEGYWNLQLYSTDKDNPGMHVIDMGLSKRLIAYDQQRNQEARERELGIDKEKENENNPLNSITGINEIRYQASTTEPDKAKYIYMFNRKTTLFSDGELGSELLDLNVEFNLPQVVAVQAIANVGGPAQKSLLQSIDIPELRRLSLIQNIFAPCDADKNRICKDTPCEDDSLENLRKELAEANKAYQDAQSYYANTLIVPEDPQASGFLATLASGVSNELSGGSAIIQTGLNSTQLNEAKNRVDTLNSQIANVEAQRSLNNPNLINIIREYADLGTALELVEANPSSMMKKMNLDSMSTEAGRIEPSSHAFSSSNLTKTIVDLTFPGIGGISLFQSFLVDRVPSILERGFYIVTKIAHEFSPEKGWITKLQGRFRFRPNRKNVETAPQDPCADEKLPPERFTEASGENFTNGLYSIGTQRIIEAQQAFGPSAASLQLNAIINRATTAPVTGPTIGPRLP